MCAPRLQDHTNRSSTIAGRTLGHYTQRMAGLVQSLKCCLNSKVLVGLGAVAAAVLLLAPNLVASAFPLLVALVCPLSMLVMMGSMAVHGVSVAIPSTVSPTCELRETIDGEWRNEK